MNRLLFQAPRFGQTTARRVSLWSDPKARLNELKKKQVEYQMSPSVPIYLKDGKFDYFMYYATLGLTLIGIGVSFKAVYQMANAK